MTYKYNIDKKFKINGKKKLLIGIKLIKETYHGEKVKIKISIKFDI